MTCSRKGRVGLGLFWLGFLPIPTITEGGRIQQQHCSQSKEMKVMQELTEQWNKLAIPLSQWQSNKRITKKSQSSKNTVLMSCVPMLLVTITVFSYADSLVPLQLRTKEQTAIRTDLLHFSLSSRTTSKFETTYLLHNLLQWNKNHWIQHSTS